MKIIIGVIAAAAIAANVYAGALAELGPADAVKAPAAAAQIVYKSVGAGTSLVQFQDESGLTAVTAKYSNGEIYGSLSYCLAEEPVNVWFSRTIGLKNGGDRLEADLVRLGQYKAYDLRLNGKHVPADIVFAKDSETVAFGGSVFAFAKSGGRITASASGSLTAAELRVFKYFMLFHAAVMVADGHY